MIKMVVAVRHPENMDLLCPVLACDNCGGQLTVQSRGIALWAWDGGQVYTVHKGLCDRALEARLGKGHLLSRELDQLVDEMAQNYARPLADEPSVHRLDMGPAKPKPSPVPVRKASNRPPVSVRRSSSVPTFVEVDGPDAVGEYGL